ncbi:MAG: hypothetical protein OXN83_00325, partial [Oligoflexia bacterium]|nr:hypothetical protein [Oligoflexia bacterium]
NAYLFVMKGNPGIYKAYIEGDKLVHLVKGLTALTAIGLGFIGVLHLGANFADMAKHIRSNKGQKHQEKVNGFLKQIKSAKNNFINYVEKNRVEFTHNLSNAEKKKLGIPLTIKLGLNDIESHQILKTTVSLDSLYSALESNKKLFLEITAQEESRYIILELNSSAKQSQSLNENQISLSLNNGKKNIERFFNISEGELRLFLDSESSKINPNLSMNLEISGENTHIAGFLQNANFTSKEHERLNKILTEIEIETGKTLLHSDDFLTQEKIKSLNQALTHLLVGYSSWAKTFRFLGLSWNWFFFARSVYISPTTMAKLLYYSKYFKVTFEDKHSPTVFNGGLVSHLEQLITANSIREINKENRSSKVIADFENQIIQIEKLFLEEVSAQAYLELTKLAGENPTEITTLSQGPKNLQTHEIKNKRLRMFHGIYKRELFRAVMQDYLSDLTGIPQRSGSDSQLKIKGLAKFLTDETLFENKPSQADIRKRVEQIAEEKQITYKSLQAVDSLLTGLLKRVSAMSEEASQKALDPSRNLQMNRMATAQRMLNDPEALARATRQQLTHFIIDKP